MTLQRRWNGLKLRNKLVLSMALISALLTGSALLIVQVRVNAQIDGEIEQQVRVSLATFQNFETRSNALAESQAALVANVPSLEAALSTDDPRTIEDPVHDISGMLAQGTVLLLADRERRVVARYPAGQGLRPDTAAGLFQQSLREGSARAWWYGDGRLYQVFLHPIYRGEPAEGNFVGTLVLGQEVDQALARQISRLASGQVVFSYGGHAVVTTLTPEQASAFEHARIAAQTGARRGVTLGGEQFAVDTETLGGAGPAPTLTILRSFTPAQRFLSALNQLILLVGLAALLLGAGVAYFISNRITRSLSDLVTGARALEGGDATYPLVHQGEDEAGQLTAAFVRMRESLDQTQKSLLRSARMEAVGQLAGGVAHDFNNLITVINGFSEMMLDKCAPDDPNRRYLQQIINAGTRAAGVTRQLLVFSRKDVAQLRPIEVNPLVVNLHRMLAMLVGEGIELALRTGSGLPPVRMDPTHIEQMVMNFSANARDAMPHGGTLTIATSAVTVQPGESPGPYRDAAPGRYVQLEVRDTGTGMDAATRQRIFEPFFTTKEVGKGTGLGLATIYGIVRQCQGYIVVESEPGQGTCFRVLLPACEAEEAEAAESHDHGSGARGSGTILLVEDEPGLRAMACEALTQAGYTVIEVANGLEALAAARTHAAGIDLVFTDVVMPKMGGRELVRELQSVRPGVPVIYTSGYSEKVPGGGLESGVNFLAKPFSPAELLNKVGEVLRAPVANL